MVRCFSGSTLETTMHTIPSTSFSHFAPGTQVFVSDGKPMPPARFTRLLRTWQNNNYEAVVLAGGPDRYDLQRKPRNGWNTREVIIFLVSRVPSNELTPIEFAELLPITACKVSPTVDYEELQRRIQVMPIQHTVNS